MNKLRVMTIFGTRPETTKMGPLVGKLRECDKIEPIVCVTAQHREMLDAMLRVFSITPDYDLDIMQKNQTLNDITARALIGLSDVMKDAKPDLVLVHGDTSTTFAGALAAFYAGIKLGHVEAGLRSFDIRSPFPEEANRRLVSPLASLYFCPTRGNRRNLEREGVTDGIYMTGNTAIDLVYMLARDDYKFKDPFLRTLDFSTRRVIMMTAHRRENYGEGFENIFSAVREIAETYKDTRVVYPVHMSPTVREAANRILGGVDNIHLIEPTDVDDNINLMKRSFMVLTDSGGLQEEAPALGKPVLVLRRETERPEAVEAGTVRMAGVKRDDIVGHIRALLDDPAEYRMMAKAANPYGDGKASERIVSAILHSFGMGERPEEFGG